MESRSMREDFLSGSFGLKIEGEVANLRRQWNGRMEVLAAMAVGGEVARAGSGRRKGREKRGEARRRRILGALFLKYV